MMRLLANNLRRQAQCFVSFCDRKAKALPYAVVAACAGDLARLADSHAARGANVSPAFTAPSITTDFVELDAAALRLKDATLLRGFHGLAQKHVTHHWHWPRREPFFRPLLDAVALRSKVVWIELLPV